MLEKFGEVTTFYKRAVEVGLLEGSKCSPKHFNEVKAKKNLEAHNSCTKSIVVPLATPVNISPLKLYLLIFKDFCFKGKL